MALCNGRSHEALVVHEDDGIRSRESNSTEDDAEEMEQSQGLLDESGGTMPDDEEEDIDDSVLHDMDHWEQTFKNISQRHRLINRIGEGTFSTVYKAKDSPYDHRSLPTKL